MTNEQAECDVGLLFLSTPPIIVPISDRAKAKFNLDEGVYGVMFLEEAERVLSVLGTDWVLCTLDEAEGDLVQLMNLNVLH